jgi:hypothetical protein
MRLMVHVFKKICLAFAALLPAIVVFGVLSWSEISRMLVAAGYLPPPPLESVLEVGPSAALDPGGTMVSTGSAVLRLRGGVRFSEGVFVFDGHSGFASTESIGAWDCERFVCLAHLGVVFEGLPPRGRSALLLGQSRTPGGWHLLYHDRKLVLQLDGGGSELSAAWKPIVGRLYQIEVFSAGAPTILRIDGQIVARAAINPMQASNREFTFGGREGPTPVPFHGRMQNVRLAVGPL